jgi:hypothetical protein
LRWPLLSRDFWQTAISEISNAEAASVSTRIFRRLGGYCP